MGRQPRIAANQDELAARIGLGEVGFEYRPVFGREMTEDLGDTPVLARFGEFECAINCRCHAEGRYHELRAEMNG